MMNRLKLQLILVFILVPLLCGAQSPGVTGNQGSTSASNPDIMAASEAIRVLSPKVDEKIGSSAMTVRFQLVNEGLAPDPSPTYRVQLDGRDPVETTSTEYSFTGLTPGKHVITIDLVDANHTPIAGSHTVVNFKTYSAGVNNSQQTGAIAPPQVYKAKLSLPAGNAADELPASGGELPLLSIVGFGVLVGGVISAMRTRK